MSRSDRSADLRSAAGRGLRAAESVLRSGRDLVLPEVCGGCRRPGTRWCGTCATTLTDAPFLLTPTVPTGVEVWALSHYRGPAREAVLALKEQHRRDLAAGLGAALAHGLTDLARWGELPDGPGLQLIPAPTRTHSARRRGGDTVTAMARAAASALGPRVDVCPALVTSPWAADSAGLSARERTRNLRGRICLRPQAEPCRECVTVLIDDVATTGATTAESVRVLAGHEIEVVMALVVAAA